VATNLLSVVSDLVVSCRLSVMLARIQVQKYH